MYLVLQGDVLLVVLGLGLGQALLVLVLVQILHVVLLKLFLTPAEITNEANLILCNLKKSSVTFNTFNKLLTF